MQARQLAELFAKQMQIKEDEKEASEDKDGDCEKEEMSVEEEFEVAIVPATRPEKRIKHYRSSQSILLVGEGDLSFAVCLANAFGIATNMVATTRDSEVELITKYGDAKANIQVLNSKGCTLLHGLDARTLSKHVLLRNQVFDRIVFNFPHAGILWVYREHDHYQIQLHQELVRDFFKSAYKLLSYTGEIHVTHKTAHPFDRWNITELAKEADLELVKEVCFSLWEYPGYCNKKGEGHGSRCNDSFPVGACSTFMFGKY